MTKSFAIMSLSVLATRLLLASGVETQSQTIRPAPQVIIVPHIVLPSVRFVEIVLFCSMLTTTNRHE